jgi:regulator of sigma E protease
VEGGRAALAELTAAIEAAEVSPEARRTADRGLTEIADGLSDDAYWRSSTWKRIAAIIAGPAANVVGAIALFTIFFMAGGGQATQTVDSVVKGTPAAKVGLLAGDKIVAINSRAVTEPEQIPERIQASKGRPITLLVERSGRPITLGPVRPVKDAGVYRLGFRLKGTGLSFGPAVWRSIKLTGIVSREIVLSLGRLFHHEGRKEITSTVGIVDQSASTLKQGIAPYLGVLGLISLSLALFNLLPLLPLDGGHIAFSIVEGVRRQAVPREVYERLSAVGIALVLLLFFVGLSNDIGRIGG